MRCHDCREAISARLDGELDPADAPRVDAHLAGCVACRRFDDRVAHVTRVARTRVAEPAPDLVAVVVDAAGPPWGGRDRVRSPLRMALGGVGVAQLGLAAMDVAATVAGQDGAARLAGAGPAHLARARRPPVARRPGREPPRPPTSPGRVRGHRNRAGSGDDLWGVTSLSENSAVRVRLGGGLLLAARLVLGGVWIAAGLTKITDLNASVRAVRAYQLLPEALAQVVGAALPPVEILLGVLLVVGLTVRAAAVVSAVLMAAFVVGIASVWARGLRIDCGCFGSGGQLAAGADPTYGWELARDAGLLVLALVLAYRPDTPFGLDRRLRRGTTAELVRR